MPQVHHIFQQDWQEATAGIKLKVMLEKSTEGPLEIASCHITVQIQRIWV